MELKIDRGLKSYDVTDADGTQLGKVFINPADLGIYARLDEARRNIQELASGLTDAFGVEDIAKVDKAIKEQINYIFGSDASAVFFQGVSSLALLPDGALVFEKVLLAVVPMIEDAVGDAVKASKKRVAKHTAAYVNKTKGLAPGQKA